MGVNESTLTEAASTPTKPSCEESLIPKEVVTKQTCTECIEIIKGEDNGDRVWHIVLVPINKQKIYEQNKRNEEINIEQFGRHIKYRSKTGELCKTSGYGMDPPEEIINWINANYDSRAVDENTSLECYHDDIRLCTIKRSKTNLPMGISLHYHRHECFHYLKLVDDHSSKLAQRAGLKSFDRIIEYNDINIKDDTTEDLKMQIEDSTNLQFQLLVCSPATYEYYKRNHKDIHSSLPTIKRRKPVNDQDDIENKYRIASDENTTVEITLVNTTTSITNDNYKTVQGLDPGIFVTARDSVEVNDDESIVSNLLPKHQQKTDRNQTIEDNRHHIYLQLASILMDSPEYIDNGIQIHRTQCHGCGLLRICDDRYRCLECPNYDLCGRCHDQHRETLDHHTGHVMVHFSGQNEIFAEIIDDIEKTVTLNSLKEKYRLEEHTFIECNHCQMNPIIGLRFKCDTCRGYNLCINCMKLRVHDTKHPLLAIGKNHHPQIPIDDIELGEEIGEGGFGAVYKAKWLSKNRIVACKVIKVTPDKAHLEKSFFKEIAAYTELSGPYIVKFHGYNIQELSNGNRRCMLILEYVSRGSLTSVLRQKQKISLRSKVEIACQIASAMRKIHSHDMMHRDIRPDNILIQQDYTAKLGDMGITRVWTPDDIKTRVGCLSYMPLEFYKGKFSKESDVFTFGLTMNELFTQVKHHFDDRTCRIRIIEKSPIFTELIQRCLHDDPKQRPTAIEIETTLRRHRLAIEKFILENQIKYGDLTIENKNVVFITVYEVVQASINEQLKNEFPFVQPSNKLMNILNSATQILQYFRLDEPHDNH